MTSVGRNIAAPLLFINLVMYFIVLGFASWCLDSYIDGQTETATGMGGNGATGFLLTFAIIAAVAGIVSKIAGGGHIRSWRSDSLAEAGSSSLIAWAFTALAFGFACKHINIKGWRGWRLRIVEAFIMLLTFTQFLYVCIHAPLFNKGYGPEYRDADHPRHTSGYGLGYSTDHPGELPVSKGGSVMAGSGV